MRAADGSGELPVDSYELFSSTEVLGRMALERMLAGLSKPRYPVGLEPVGARTEQAATSASRSAVSRRFVAARMRRAYDAESALAAEAELCALDKTDPGAAASLREGLAETLTVLRLGVPPNLTRTLRSTNAVKNMISICRAHSANVKRWRDWQMELRWCAAGMVEAGKQFRRVNDHLYLQSLRNTLEKVAESVAATRHDEAIHAA